MILEALTAAAMPEKTPHERMVKRLGYAHESIAISARYARNFLKWRPHLKTCERLIASAISQVPSTGRIVILGSGAWHDLPVRKLARHGAQIDLVDIVHLPMARAKARLYKNFNLIEADLTGFASAWDAWDGENVGTMPLPPEIAPLPMDGADLVISVNMLSQIPLAFVSSPPESEAEDNLAAALQRAHVNALRQAPGRVLLLADCHRTEVSHEIHEIPTVRRDILPGDPQEKWSWHIAPVGEVDKNTDIKLRVGAWSDFN